MSAATAASEGDSGCNWPVFSPWSYESRPCGRGSNSTEWPAFCWQHQNAVLSYVADQIDEGRLGRDDTDRLLRAFLADADRSDAEGLPRRRLRAALADEINRRIAQNDLDDLPAIDDLVDARLKARWSA